jgi:hypothetical protein
MSGELACTLSPCSSRDFECRTLLTCAKLSTCAPGCCRAMHSVHAYPAYVC